MPGGLAISLDESRDRIRLDRRAAGTSDSVKMCTLLEPAEL